MNRPFHPIEPPVIEGGDPCIWVYRVGVPDSNFDSVTATADECRRMAVGFLRAADRMEAHDPTSIYVETLRHDAEMCIRWAQLKDFAARDAHKYTRKES